MLRLTPILRRKLDGNELDKLFESLELPLIDVLAEMESNGIRVDVKRLEELSRQVGVSQFYLSRIFSQEMRMTIPQFLRQIRMQKAASYLAAGSHNVTEAAFAVGYSSLGHFSKSFCEVMGCCPTLYPQAKSLQKRR